MGRHDRPRVHHCRVHGRVAVLPDLRPSVLQARAADAPLALFAHLGASAVALALGPFQLSTRLRSRRLGLHRWMGRIYILSVVAGGLSAIALATTSSGGVPAHAGFGLLGGLWVLTAVIAYQRIRVYDIADHRRWTIRSYSLAFAAVTLRIYLPLAVGAHAHAVRPGVSGDCVALLGAEPDRRRVVVPAALAGVRARAGAVGHLRGVMNAAVLDTPRLLLREMTAADLDFVATMLAHPEVNHFYERRFTRAESKDWLSRQLERYRRDGHGLWLVIDRPDGRTAGPGRPLHAGGRGYAAPGSRLAPSPPVLGQGLRNRGGRRGAGCGVRALGVQTTSSR